MSDRCPLGYLSDAFFLGALRVKPVYPLTITVERYLIYAVFFFGLYSIFEDILYFYFILGMGENNCSWTRKPMLHRDTITAAAAIYKGVNF